MLFDQNARLETPQPLETKDQRILKTTMTQGLTVTVYAEGHRDPAPSQDAMATALAITTLIETSLSVVELQREILYYKYQCPLTSALNPRALEPVITNARAAGPIGLIFTDIDRMKALNDTHGHNAGTAAIRHAADIISSEIRAIDRVIRFGGDEFVVVCPRVSAMETKKIAARIAAAFAGLPVMHDGKEYAMTMTVGHTLVEATDEASIDEILGRADQDMYRQKKSAPKK